MDIFEPFVSYVALQLGICAWFGLLMGALSTTLVPRLSQTQIMSWRQAYNELSRPSACSCGRLIGHPASWPLIGWIAHRGRCQCGKKIGFQDTLQEIAGIIWMCGIAYPFLGTQSVFIALLMGTFSWVALCYCVARKTLRVNFWTLLSLICLSFLFFKIAFVGFIMAPFFPMATLLSVFGLKGCAIGIVGQAFLFSNGEFV